mmetsp:Transcript_107685/g.169986  ORF Transcript_107685/g.169986 Transcript_107685/m.169986 type:complete len:100 (+) Transcript_107685:3538-3837(+)
MLLPVFKSGADINGEAGTDREPFSDGACRPIRMLAMRGDAVSESGGDAESPCIPSILSTKGFDSGSLATGVLSKTTCPKRLDMETPTVDTLQIDYEPNS